MKELLAVTFAFASLATQGARAQTLDLGNIKLTLGMSKQEVFKQAAFTMGTGASHLTREEIPDDVVLFLASVDDTKYCVAHNPGTCFAEVQFSHSRLNYASKSTYTAGTPERTLSEIIGSIVAAFQISSNELKPVNCEIFYFAQHDNSGLAKESVNITCAGHTVSISTMPFEGRPIGDISESVGKQKAEKTRQ